MKPALIALLMCLCLLVVHTTETITLPVKRTAYEKVWKAALAITLADHHTPTMQSFTPLQSKLI
jgi:hypothetical protein